MHKLLLFISVHAALAYLRTCREVCMLMLGMTIYTHFIELSADTVALKASSKLRSVYFMSKAGIISCTALNILLYGASPCEALPADDQMTLRGPPHSKALTKALSYSFCTCRVISPAGDELIGEASMLRTKSYLHPEVWELVSCHERELQASGNGLACSCACANIRREP